MKKDEIHKLLMTKHFLRTCDSRGQKSDLCLDNEKKSMTNMQICLLNKPSLPIKELSTRSMSYKKQLIRNTS